jgi:hypothetical protein
VQHWYIQAENTGRRHSPQVSLQLVQPFPPDAPLDDQLKPFAWNGQAA